MTTIAYGLEKLQGYTTNKVAESTIQDILYRFKGKGYDWLGILFSQVLPLNLDHPERVFCSELNAAMLGLSKPASYSPEKLYQ